MRRLQNAILLSSIILLFGCRHEVKETPSPSCKLMVFAASSLSDLTEAVRVAFEKDYPTCQVSFNFGASNALGMQIEAGARADVFLSAAAAPVDHLLNSAKVELGPKRVLFSNRLAIITNRSNPIEIKDSCALKDANLEHLAIGQPDAVPAGIYAKEYLSKLSCGGVTPWAVLEPKLLPMPNVRAVLSVVEQQPKLAGVVYVSDALSSKAVKVQFVVQGPNAPRINYWGIRVGPSAPFADALLQEFYKPKVQEVIRQMGFVVDKS